MNRKTRRRLKFFGFTLTSLLVIGLVGGGGGYLYLSRGLPDEGMLREYPYKRVSEVYAEDGQKIGEFYTERRYVIPYQRIPDQAIAAVLAAEDADYFEHRGVDYPALLRATIKSALAGEAKQGGSTVTMQAAKVAMLTPEKKIKRKLKQIILARRMEETLNKKQILGLYLNLVYFGRGAYGIEAAAQEYFGKSAQDLTPGEAAVLAALPQRPSDYSQEANRDRLLERQQWILKQWEQKIPKWDRLGHNPGGYSVQAIQRAQTEPVEILPHRNLNLEIAPYFVEQVRREVQERYGDKAVHEGGLRIYTTANAQMSLAAHKAVRDGLIAMDRRQGWRGPVAKVPKAEREAWLEKSKEQLGEDGELHPGDILEALVIGVSNKTQTITLQVGDKRGYILKRDVVWARERNFEVYHEYAQIKNVSWVADLGDVLRVQVKGDLNAEEEKSKQYDSKKTYFELYQEPEVEGALLSMDPHTGAIRAMVGGYDYERSEYNRAFQALRQPGSAFKPILYSAAVDRGFTPSTIIVDSPIVYAEDTTIGDHNEKYDDSWKPKNYGSKFYGDTTFRTALVLSRNVVSIKVLQQTGIRYTSWYAQNLGISNPPTRDLSMALGSSEVTLKDLCRAYAVFPSGGKRPEPFFIQAVMDNDGTILEWNDPRTRVFYDSHDVLRVAESEARGPEEFLTEYERAYPTRPEKGVSLAGDRVLRAKGRPPGRVIDPRTAYIMTNLLRDVIRHGTGANAASLGRPAGGKTGTTDDEMDAWFMGFTPELVTGVWVGFDEKKPLGRLETGGRAAAPIWTQYMKEALEGYPIRDFAVPQGIVFQKIDRESGLLACPNTDTPVFVAYKLGTEPTEYVCRQGVGTGLPVEGITPTNVPPGMPPTGLPTGLPPQ